MRESFVAKVAITLFLAATMALSGGIPAQAQVNVTTYHYDNLRTGWNQNETTLTQGSFSNFGLLQTVSLDDQVDAQPLLVNGVTINGNQHNVVYVATENNSVYAIDAQSGQVLLQTNLGTPVQYPLGCGNNGPNVGIDGTPVIDTTTGNIYVIAYVNQNNTPTYFLHALSLTTLADTATPVQISAQSTLKNGSRYDFQASVQRQRPGLLLSGGNLYAGFGSFCDFSANRSRGWVLGWQESTLSPFATNKLNNQLTSRRSPDSFYLTSVWMSGYGLAANSAGSVYFVTGNSDYSGTTLSKNYNITETAAQMSGDLTTLQSRFTPSDWSQLENYDEDFGSGGLTLLPPQSGTFPDLAVAVGKAGTLFLMDADNLHSVFNTYNVGSCWCGQSYFVGSDGLGRVVTSGNSTVEFWKLNTSGRRPSLTEVTHADINNGNTQDPGFFTTISSNGTTAGSAIVWAVGRPQNGGSFPITLSAVNPDNGQVLFSETAGGWPNTGGNANIVPVEANGLVYVASYKMLTIFGPGGSPIAHLPPVQVVDRRVPLAPGEHEIYGTVRTMKGANIVITKRTGEELQVDASLAQSSARFAEPAVGHALIARGTIGKSGVFEASAILHAKDHPAAWPSDR